MIDFFTIPLQYPFMQRALIIAIIIAVVCALLSCLLVLKGWSLMGDAISHAILPGVVLASATGIPLTIGAFISGLFCALATGYVHESSRLKEDTALGIVFAGMFAIGLLLFHAVDTGNQHIMHILFGNILGIEDTERWQVYIISALVFGILVVKWRDFSLYVFDEQQARVSGLPVSYLKNGLLVLLALTSVAAIQAVGVVLVVAMLIGPGITAQVLCKRFSTLLITACLVSIFSSAFGVLISYHIDGSTGACIVLTQAALFTLALIGKQTHTLYYYHIRR